ncbi:hypothetical protein FHS43_006355 [Streptosporangium becharense]|uniref:Secreted protein n=1 Tax=Streptosporangium becharense TaxID=1816182 RepID=A0A7W9ICC0_9ACTN|nr:hypothetical protein [Streptosporangium becharense]MBB2915040.1 hypothetical protein [Streptosporangium becharense]MBB5818089.1 hypothetical protein [Streptosporangium becharense]
MRTGIRALLGLTTAAALVLGGSTTASAASDPGTWKWGSIYSADHKAYAKGKVVALQSGFEVSGTLNDSAGAGCGWVQLSYRDRFSTEWSGANLLNCFNRPTTFRTSVGGIDLIRARVCEGTYQRPTACSNWRVVFSN